MKDIRLRNLTDLKQEIIGTIIDLIKDDLEALKKEMNIQFWCKGLKWRLQAIKKFKYISITVYN